MSVLGPSDRSWEVSESEYAGSLDSTMKDRKGCALGYITRWVALDKVCVCGGYITFRVAPGEVCEGYITLRITPRSM